MTHIRLVGDAVCFSDSDFLDTAPPLLFSLAESKAALKSAPISEVLNLIAKVSLVAGSSA